MDTGYALAKESKLQDAQKEPCGKNSPAAQPIHKTKPGKSAREARVAAAERPHTIIASILKASTFSPKENSQKFVMDISHGQYFIFVSS